MAITAVYPDRMAAFAGGSISEFIGKNVLRALPLAACCALAALILLAPGSLEPAARTALAITVMCIWGWTFTRLPDSIVAVAGAVGLTLTGAIKEETLFAALGHELVWLLLAAFLMAAVIKSSGLLDAAMARALKPVKTVHGLFYSLTTAITATAFFIPSTSGRAALLLPVFLALAPRLPDPRLVKPLALLFPTIVLLSAGGSLIGAGAHVVAVEAIAASGGAEIGFARWLALALPPAVISCLAATWLILRLFAPKDTLGLPITVDGNIQALSATQVRVALAVAAVVVLWAAVPLHGLEIATIAIAGAALLTTRPFTAAKSKELFKSVEVELIVFLAATMVVANAITSSGADKWLASWLLNVLPASVTGSFALAMAIIVLVALLAHLVVNSRSARAAVLIPAFALPLAALCHDVQAAVLAAVLGTGFCQTTMASAKPVAVFGNADRETFHARDLLRLAVPLLVVKFAILSCFAILVWPQMAGAPKTQAAAAAAIAIPAVALPIVKEATRIEPDADGAMCSARELRIVMIAMIGERRMWASGWWKVWDRLGKQGYPIEQKAVKAVYRGEDLVTLRKNSVRLGEVLGNPAGIEAASAACRS